MDIFLNPLYFERFTLIFIVKIRYDFFEVVFAEGLEDFLLVFAADYDMTILEGLYFISFYIEFINSTFSSISLNIYI